MLGVGVSGCGRATPIRAAVEVGALPETGGVGGPDLGYSKERVLTRAHREPILSCDDDPQLLLCGVGVVMIVSSEVRTTGATAAALMLLKATAPEKGEVKAA